MEYIINVWKIVMNVKCNSQYTNINKKGFNTICQNYDDNRKCIKPIYGFKISLNGTCEKGIINCKDFDEAN